MKLVEFMEKILFVGGFTGIHSLKETLGKQHNMQVNVPWIPHRQSAR